MLAPWCPGVRVFVALYSLLGGGAGYTMDKPGYLEVPLCSCISATAIKNFSKLVFLFFLVDLSRSYVGVCVCVCKCECTRVYRHNYTHTRK